MVQDPVTAETDDAVADQVIEGAKPAETIEETPAEPAPLTQADIARVTQEIENRAQGRFNNWTAEREAKLAKDRQAYEANSVAEVKRIRDFTLSRMDEDEKAEFLRSERDQRIDAFLNKPEEPVHLQEPESEFSNEQLQLASEVGGYARGKGVTLGSTDTWIWEGATDGMTFGQYAQIARQNIDKKSATPAPAAPAAAPTPVDTPADTTSAPKTTTVSVDNMTIQEAADAMLNGDISNTDYRNRIAQ